METLGFTITGDYITQLIRQYWVELEHKKIVEIKKGTDGISFTIIRSIAEGINQIIGENDDMEVVEDDVHELAGISLLYTNIRKRYNDKLMDLFDRFQGYSHNQMVCDKEDIQYYMNLALKASDDIRSLRENFKAFLEICEDVKEIRDPMFNILQDNKILFDLQQKQEREQAEDHYHDVMKHYLISLEFDPNQVLKKIVENNNNAAIMMMRIDHTNGYRYLYEHREAQERMEDLRNKIGIFPENILDTIWNSGWLAPDGRFFGCSDLSHEEFSKTLYEYNKNLNLCLNEDDWNPSCVDRVFEKAKWIKFSSGRWLFDQVEDYFDGKKWWPTKAQYNVILEWAKYRSNGIKIVFGDDTKFVNLDIIESQRNSVK